MGMNREKISSAGFTLTELVIVLFVLGIIAALAAKQMIGTVTNERAQTAATRLTALGLANRRYAFDHDGKFVHRLRKLGSLFECDNAECLPCDGPVCPSCNLIACKYVDKMAVTDPNFYLNAVSPESGLPACGIPQPEKGSPIIACASQGSLTEEEDDDAKGQTRYRVEYLGWAYTYHKDGTTRPHGGAPIPIKK